MFPRTFIFLCCFLVSLFSVAQESCPETPRDQLQQEHQSLLEIIDTNNRLYEAGQPAITDEEYDALTQRQRLINRCLKLNIQNDPVPPLDQRHRYPMGSLKKSVDNNDIERFIDYARKLGSPLVVQPKIDGVAVELVYRNGLLVQALTRGQWRTGKGLNLLSLTSSIPAIPQFLPNNRKEIVLRGELYSLPDNAFAKNASSPRHYVAGLINRETPPQTELHSLKFFPWQWVNSPLASLRANVREFEEWGFTGVIEHTVQVKDLDDIGRLKNKYHNQNSLPLDGVVIKLDSLAIQKRMGHLDGTPYWALAWKFPSTTASTTITDIRWTIGRTGQITIILGLKPVQLQGITVSSVNGGPIEHFQNLDFAVSDTMSVALKGAATPVMGNALLRPDHRKKPQFPNPNLFNGLTCLTVTALCREQFIARLKWLTGQHGLNMPLFTETKLKELIDAGKVIQVADLFTLTADDIPTETLKLLREHSLSLGQALRALSIPGVGRKKSDQLAKKAGDWKTINRAPPEQFPLWIKVSASEAQTITTYLQTSEIKELSKYLFRDD